MNKTNEKSRSVRRYFGIVWCFCSEVFWPDEQSWLEILCWIHLGLGVNGPLGEIPGQMFQDCKWGFALCIHLLFFHHLAVGWLGFIFYFFHLPAVIHHNVWMCALPAGNCTLSTEVKQEVVLKLQDHGQHPSQALTLKWAQVKSFSWNLEQLARSQD